MPHPAPHPYNTRPPRIGRRFVAGSLLVHALVLFAVPGPDFGVRPAPPALQAKLRPAPPVEPTRIETPAPPPRAPLAPRREPGRETDRTPPPVITLAPTPTEASPPLAARPAAAPEAKPAAETARPMALTAAPAGATIAPPAASAIAEAPREHRGKPSTLWLAEYTQTVSGQVGRQKQYPQIARLRGWQGTAVVVILLSADGTVLGARIAESSGHDVLDRQALAMVRQAEPLPPLPDARSGNPLEVRLPIVFKLASSE